MKGSYPMMAAFARVEVNNVPPVVINAALIVLSAACGFLAKFYFSTRVETRNKAAAILQGNDAMKARLADLEGKLALVNAAVIPISTAFQAILIKELTHFHTPEMDALLVKVGPPNTLTGDEETRLAVLLAERTKDMGPKISDSERDAASILPAVMRRARKEQEMLQTGAKAHVVTIVGTVNSPQGEDGDDQLKEGVSRDDD